jgi:hypothetical protein
MSALCAGCKGTGLKQCIDVRFGTIVETYCGCRNGRLRWAREHTRGEVNGARRTWARAKGGRDG